MAENLDIRVHETLAAVEAGGWDALVPAHFPFAEHAYLLAMETGGCVGSERGWLPWYMTATRGKSLDGALCLYAKDNSYGEYIFDWGWASAYARHGIAYYPKVVAAVPFTPATGRKLLVRPGAPDAAAVKKALLDAALRATQTARASSLHFLFLDPDERGDFAAAGFLVRHSFQYHWHNRGYATFDDFLASLKPRKRKQIARERAQLAEAGLTIEMLEGDALTADLARRMYGLYLATIEKMGAIPYLTETFYEEVFAAMKDRIVLVTARAGERLVAAAILYRKGDRLYGRYWGATEDIRNLHFEICYYRPIELAIREKLIRFEAGAQGEHKLARGFTPELTYSAHWIAHEGFRSAIARFIDEEKQGIERVFEELAGHSPYR